MRKLALLLLVVVLLLVSTWRQPAKAMIPVIDPGAIAQLVEQIKQTLEVIGQLQALNDWAQLDHLNLALGEFNAFISKYKGLLDELMNEIESYQNGGLLGQIQRLEEIYFSYSDGWENQGADDFTAKADPYHPALKKQLLWTRIQLKHAAKVAAKVRSSLPDTQAELHSLQQANFASEGVMQTLKVGNELTGMVARSLEVLNTQLGEVLQAQVADGLERNTRDGLQKNRAREALTGWGEKPVSESPAPLNPFGAY